MKVIIISRGRTRSSHLQKSISNTHNLRDLKENLIRGLHAYDPEFDIRYKNSKINIDELRFNQHKQLLINWTKTFFAQNNYVVKLWPRMLVSKPHEITYNLQDYKPNIVTDLSTILKLQEYDKVYFLDRNLIDSVYSWVYANITNNFLFFEGDKSYVKHLQQYDKISVKEEHFSMLKFYIYEIALQNKIREYLLIKNINHTLLNYDEIPDYVDKNFNKLSIYKDAKFDYSKKIANYDELSNYINQTYDQALIAVKDINFV
jgi:hypothetical protein